ncbi:golgin subfamily B member 1-like [Mustelus asterias]
MLSRLSDLAKGVNNVLQDLSGDDIGDETNAAEGEETSQQPEMETCAEASEDVLERLAQTEQLVVQLKELIREKDLQLQNKEVAMKEEKELSDAKLSKLKLQAKAKVASLNARIEELQKQSLQKPSSQPEKTEEQTVEVSLKESSTLEQQEIEKLKCQLQQQEESCQTLQAAVNSMKDQLQTTNELLKQKEAEHAQQLRSVQEVILEKDTRFQEHIQKHEEELTQLASGSEINKELQQTVKSLQRKLEEKEEALLGRTRVVEMLQQELNDSDRNKQVLGEKLQEAEANIAILHTALEAERLSAEARLSEVTEKYETELAEKNSAVTQMQQALQGAQSSCTDLTTQNQQLQSLMGDRERMCKTLTDEIKELQDGLKKVEATEQSEAELASEREASVKVQELEEKVQELQTAAEEQEVASQNRLAELEEEKGSLLWKTVDYEEVKTENEYLQTRIKELEQQRGTEELAHNTQECIQVGDTNSKLLDTIVLDQTTQSADSSPGGTGQTNTMEDSQDIPEPEQKVTELMEVQHGGAEAEEGSDLQSLKRAVSEKDKELVTVTNQLAEAQRDIVRLSQQLLDRPEIALTQDGAGSLIQVLEGNQFLPLEQKIMSAADKNLNVLVEQKEGRSSITLTEESPNAGSEMESTTVSVQIEGKNTSVIQVEQRSTTVVHLDESIYSTTEMYSSGEHLAYGATSLGGLQMVSGKEQSGEIIGGFREFHMVENEEVKKLQVRVQELEKNLEAVETLYGKQLEDKQEELQSLNQRVLDYEKEAADAKETINNLGFEKDQLLDQIKRYDEELCEIAQLKERLAKAEEDAQNEEKQRLLILENTSIQSGLLEEQLHSAENESRSKDVKMEALEKELDIIQCRVSEQAEEAKGLRGQLQEKEEAVLSLKQLTRDAESKVEELLQKLASGEQELMSVQQSLSEETHKVQQLQSSLSQREAEMAELTMSMSEKMVALNEDKFSLGNEVKHLKEQLLMLQKDQEGHADQEKPTGESNLPSQEREQMDRLQSNTAGFEMLLREKDGLEKQVENLKKENEQIKRKLQAALIKRKELLKKVEEMSQEAQNKELHSEERFPAERGAECSDTPSESTRPLKEEQTQDPQTVDLIRALAEKETDLQNVNKALQDQAASVTQLQNLVEDLRQKLQEKAERVNSLEADLFAQQTSIQQLTSQHEVEKQCVEQESTEADSSKTMAESIATVQGLVTDRQTELEGKLFTLEREKDQLQKKLEEAVSSRKDTMKKAQEKNRHHREQVKQQKEEYNALLENFNQQSQEKAGICEELAKAKEQLRLLEGRPSAAGALQAEKPPDQGIPEEIIVPEENQHLGWSPEGVGSSILEPVQAFIDLSEPRGDDLLVAQLKEDLQKVQDEKDGLSLKLQHLAQLEQKTREESAESLDRITELQGTHHQEKEELLKEVDILKKRYQDMELKLALEEARAESYVSEQVAVLNKEYEELKDILQKKDEEIEHFHTQLKEKDEILKNLQQKMSDQEDLVGALQTQIEEQTKEFEEQSKHLQTEILETQQKQEEDTEEAKSKQQIQRKLQAALISRKESLKANKLLKEELASVTALKEELNSKLGEMEKTAEDLRQDKEDLLTKMLNLQEQKEQLIIEVNKSLTENQNLSASCESLKLVIEGVTQEKESLQQEIESLKGEQVAESSEWQRKHRDLQKEYETLLQSYENVGSETERMSRVLDVSKQEKQGLLFRIREGETQKLEVEKQLQEAVQEQEGMKEKMRKFAKSKQQKIMELEEEIERLQSEQCEIRNQVKPSASSDSTESQLQEELQNAKRETEEAMNELETLKAQRDALDLETDTLRQQLKDISEKLEASQKELEKNRNNVIQEPEIPMEEAIVASFAVEVKQESSNKLGSSTESAAAHVSPEGSQEVPDPGYFDEIAKCRQELLLLTEKLTQMETDKQTIEDEMHELMKTSQLLKSEKEALEEQLAKNQDKFKLMQESASKLEQNNQQVKQQVEKLRKEKAAAESDRDDLEERLMNQLAELNGSIANYQQESKDSSNKISHLELTLKDNQKQMDKMEEEVRQLKSEKAEAAAKMQKDFEEKVKSMQRGREGRKVHNKELQELLKVKQQEIKQLQKDCIRYQEKISDLEKTIKALEFVQQETQKSLDAALKETTAKMEDCKKTRAELFSCKVRLDDTQSEAARILADNLKLKEELQTSETKAQDQASSMEEEHKRRLNLEKNEHRKQLRNMQEKLECLEREKKNAEDSIDVLKDMLEKKKSENNKVQADFNENLAKLAAFTRSMSSLQNDRDRIIDESKKWEIKFNDAILKKEEDIRDKEDSCNELKEQLRQASAHCEELEIKLSRLEHSEQEWESKFKSEEEVHEQMMKKVEDENRQLFSKSEEFQKLLKDSQNELLKLTEEAKSLREQIADLDSSLEKLEKAKSDLEANLKQREAEAQNYLLTCEQLQSDLQSSKSLTEKLHGETAEKEEKIVSLLAAKEEAVANAIGEAQQQRVEEIERWESRVQKVEEEKSEGEQAIRKLRKETEDLDEKLKKTEEELKQQKIKLESFTKSMASLQNDRERVLSDYKQLEQKHLEAIVEKDQLIQEAATENNKLKNELRSQQGQKDDLNSENAKLNAQLIQYREDLNQVISMKDSQYKQFLNTQLERIKELENEKTDIEKLLKGVENGSEELSQENKTLKGEKQNQKEQLQLAEKATAELKEEVARLTIGGPVQELQQQLDEKTGEVEKLVASLASTQEKVAELELKVVVVKEEAGQRLHDTEVRYEKELESLQHNAGIMRNETETAEERVAELARDLMETEQRLRESIEEAEQFKAQNLSFGKAMSSLQVSRDHLLVQLEELQQKYTSELEMEKNRNAGLRQELTHSETNCHNLAEEKERLSSEFAAMKSSTIEDNLRARVDELSKQLSSKQQDVQDLTLELEVSANQLKAFSKTVTTLQGEKDRLMGEVAKSKKVHEVKQGSAPTSSKSSEVQSLRNALSSLQNDRDRLLQEMRSLQQQQLQIGEEAAELSRLRAQLEGQSHQITNYQETQERLKKEHEACRDELEQQRSEKLSFTKQCERLKEQYLIAVSDKDKQIQELQRLYQELRLKVTQQAPEEAANPGETLKGVQTENSQLKIQLNNSLKELHQKELRIQKLNSKMSLVFEEKIALSAQLRGTGQNLRDTQQRFNELQARHRTLEQQLQSSTDLQDEKEKMDPLVDAAPGGPQGKDRNTEQHKETELRHLKQRLIEAKQIQDRSKQELNQLEGSLAEEREKRLAAEEALLSAEHRLKSVELSEWVSAQERSLNASTMEEHSMLIDLPESATPSKTRRGSRVRSFCSLLHSRSRAKLLFAVYVAALHVLFLLCFTGNL